jgi:hypothetical protein
MICLMPTKLPDKPVPLKQLQREQRQAAALRANLARRKDWARGRGALAEGEPECGVVEVNSAGGDSCDMPAGGPGAGEEPPEAPPR